MAPEQVQSGQADRRADVFGLGAVLYRTVTGQPAFGVQEVQAVFDVVYRQPTRPSELLPELPSDVDLVLAVALAKKPGDRFATAPELAAALRDASACSLSAKVRARGAAILRALPWGAVRISEQLDAREGRIR
jgi:serine/threonine-protein kinase